MLLFKCLFCAKPFLLVLFFLPACNETLTTDVTQTQLDNWAGPVIVNRAGENIYKEENLEEASGVPYLHFSEFIGFLDPITHRFSSQLTEMHSKTICFVETQGVFILVDPATPPPQHRPGMFRAGIVEKREQYFSETKTPYQANYVTAQELESIGGYPVRYFLPIPHFMNRTVGQSKGQIKEESFVFRFNCNVMLSLHNEIGSIRYYNLWVYGDEEIL